MNAHTKIMEPKGSSLTPFLTVQLAMGRPFLSFSMDGLRKHSSHLSAAQFLVSISFTPGRGTVIGVSLSELHTIEYNY